MSGLGKVLDWVSNLFFGRTDTDEYFTRFIMPSVERLRELGVGSDEIDKLVHKAIDESWIPYITPGANLRRYVDVIEADLDKEQ